MAVGFTLEFSSPNLLVYVAQRTAGGASFASIPNAGGATPDLRTDLRAQFLPAAVPGYLRPSSLNTRLLSILDTPVADDAGAEILFRYNPEIEISLSSVSGNTGVWNWSARSTGSPGAGFPTVRVEYNAAIGAVNDTVLVRIRYVFSPGH